MSETDDDLSRYEGCVRKDNQWDGRMKEGRSGNDRSDQIRSDQIRSDQIRSERDRGGQFMT